MHVKVFCIGVPRRGAHWKHMEVINLPSGKPTLKLTEGAAERLAEITPDGHNANVHLTMTDDHPWAEAQVIIAAHPKGAEAQANHLARNAHAYALRRKQSRKNGPC